MYGDGWRSPPRDLPTPSPPPGLKTHASEGFLSGSCDSCALWWFAQTWIFLRLAPTSKSQSKAWASQARVVANPSAVPLLAVGTGKRSPPLMDKQLSFLRPQRHFCLSLAKNAGNGLSFCPLPGGRRLPYLSWHCTAMRPGLRPGI